MAEGSLGRLFAMAGDEDAAVDRGTNLRSAKQPMPRQLGLNENVRTLRHWRGSVRNYFRLDDINGYFLNELLTWNPDDRDHYGLADETTGLKRPKALLKQDLVAFLETIAAFLPHAYVTETLVTSTKSIKDVWSAIESLYGAELNGASFAGINSFKRENQESYKQFYERMLDHCRMHVVDDAVKIEGRQHVILQLNRQM